jgi:hypothetical protein
LPDGATFIIPAVDDENWGQNVSNFLIALPSGVPPRNGTFSLTGDLSFGPSFGLVSQYYKSATINIASAGIIRLAKTDLLDWRNNANSANLALGINGSDQLIFNGSIVQVGVSSAITSLTGDVTATGPGTSTATLATVNSSVGSFTNATITVNAKGLITAASSGSATGITQLTGAVTAGPGSGSQVASLTSTSVTAALLTGYASSSGIVAASDTILQGIDKLNANQSLFIPAVGTITGTGTVTPDASVASTFTTTVVGTLTINGPSNGINGQKITFRLLQDGTGHSVTFATGSGNFRFGTDIGSFTASAANLTDYIGAIWNAAVSRWDIVGVSQGF